ncbi:YeeE/YedE family protein [Vibrio sp. 404]|uniref:YeeE/YedE family protein n=1 Tax=Vibrio marinisediminis TaxID=2758441 RepID=A0A7W2IUU8_9VIBR|nr:YeeE/YedE family protein [Vibrio marinisediminis]MBA5763945.1 YeeE/YedE family protein [Vibrio marinisediminis]
MFQAFPWESLFGGMLLGVSATMLLLFNGKVAGISGIVSGLFSAPQKGDYAWRVLFFTGMVLGGFFTVHLFDLAIPEMEGLNIWGVVLAGLLVGIGTRLGNGCTSGHGICGIGRLSKRSIIATCVFMSVAGLTVFVRLHLL